MNIEHKLSGKNGLFYINESGNRIGELIYSLEGADDSVMLIKHVEVKPELRGQGIGNKLVKEAADHSRREGLKVRPLCYFARVSMRSDDYKDVLA
ncbi:MAG: N-acetyltransferase [Balneolia bacterium]|nr:N-acetyltransferase [Balneolia bacterium]